jgi:hypothetical protein
MMDGQSGNLSRLLRRTLARRAIRTVGAAKLATVGAAVFAIVFGLALFAALVGASVSSSRSKLQVQCRLATSGSESPPPWLMPIYSQAASKYHLGPRGPGILASINFHETNFGKDLGISSAGAEGWMQFEPESWATFGIDADEDGVRDPDDPRDAIFAAAHLLHVDGAPADWSGAIFDYNHADWYVREVEDDAVKFGGEVVCLPVEAPAAGGSALLHQVITLNQPRAFKAIPASLWAGGESPEAVDSRIWPDVIWVLRTFHLRVTAARETGHNTHGDGTAVDLVPDEGKSWDETARAAAETLGWRESCGASGTAPVCPLMPAIQFVGYNGYPGHGDPDHAGDNAHLHISWQGASFGCGELCPPPIWVRSFPLK